MFAFRYSFERILKHIYIYIYIFGAGYRVVWQSLIRRLEMGFQYMKSFRFLFAGMLLGHIKCQLA
jgi:hypothetical protein